MSKIVLEIVNTNNGFIIKVDPKTLFNRGPSYNAAAFILQIMKALPTHVTNWIIDGAVIQMDARFTKLHSSPNVLLEK